MFRQLLIFFILGMVASCKDDAGFSKEDQRSVSDSVRKTLINYYADIHKSGLIAELAYLDSSDDFFWVPPGYGEAISYDSVAKFIKENAAAFKSIENVWDSLRIIPLSKELASYSGKIHGTMVDTSGQSYMSILIETGIMIKRRDGWKLLQGQTASLLTPPKVID